MHKKEWKTDSSPNISLSNIGVKSARSVDCVLPPAGARICYAKHKGIEGEHSVQCARVRRFKKEHTLTDCQSWGYRTKVESRHRLGITIQDPPTDNNTELLYFTYLCFHSITCLKNCRFTACLYVTMNIYLYLSTLILHVTSSQSAYICWSLSLSLHIYTHTCTGTHTQAYMYYWRTGGFSRTRHRSLVGRVETEA